MRGGRGVWCWWLVAWLVALTPGGASFGWAPPESAPGLAGIPLPLIQRAEREAWLRDYNNFVFRDDLCYARAVDVIGGLHETLTRTGAGSLRWSGSGSWDLRLSNVAKLMLVYPYSFSSWNDGSPSTLLHRWRYHVVTAVRDTAGQWHPVDPDGFGASPVSVDAWVATYSHDLVGNALRLSGLSVGTLYSALPPQGQAYLYWLPADFYQPVFNADNTQLVPYTTYQLDPLGNRSLAVDDLRAHRRALLQADAALKVSGADVLGINDADHDGIPGDVDQCTHTPPGAKVWHTGPWTGCAAGEVRDRDRISPR